MSFLRTTGPACIDVWISSPVRSRKPVLMKATRSPASAMQALRLSDVRRSSSMMPTLIVSRGRPSSCSTRPNRSTAKATSSGPCIFGFTTYIAPVRELASSDSPRTSLTLPRAVMIASRMPSGTSSPFRSSTASVVIRCPTWRMKSSERPRSVSVAAVRSRVDAVGVHRAGEGLAALGDLLGEGAVHEVQPVAVADHLVVGVDRRDGVLEVHDRGHRGLQQQVLDAGRVGRADGVVRVDLDLDVQTVVDQQHRVRLGPVAAVADELGRVLEPERVVLDGHREAVAVHGVRRDVGVRTAGQREVLVEESAAASDDLVATDLVVAVTGGELAVLGDDVGAVERVVERAPAGVDGVGGEARVEQRDDQLRAGDPGHLVVDVGGGDRDVGRLVEQVADLAQERGVLLRVRGAGMLAVPLVDLGLQLLAPGQQLAVARREVVDDRADAVPERLRVDARAGQGLLGDEAVQAGGDAEPTDLYAVCHATP